MRSLIPVLCLSLCLQACGGNTSFALFFEWGSCDFDRVRWAQADRIGRGCMMSSFLDKYHPVGMSVVEIRLLLGEPSSYADFEDPAYLVGQSSSNGSPAREQLLVFRIDRITGRCVEVVLRPAY
ncbi:hypothetical protein [Massilia sp. BSC265]|uniref:hypothetical protein n=1 Tax=Massilia sp. BSC265 TaxID=1549812 RepID=UPI0004E9527F|nr:hypothetical protein [Massilia sp. BSC265]KFI06669.1 hypothetical protein JN27_13365 [Massilia sp. BSC265]